MRLLFTKPETPDYPIVLDRSNPITKGMVAWFPMDIQCGDRFIDHVANLNKCYVSGGTFGTEFYWNNCPIGHGLRCTGAGGYAVAVSTVNSSQIVSDNDPLTVSMWLWMSDTDSYPRMYFIRGNDYYGSGWSAQITGSDTTGGVRTFIGSVVTTSGGAARYDATGSIAVPVPGPVHLGLTWSPGSSTSLRLFVNGNVDGTNSTATTTLRDSTFGFQLFGGDGGGTHSGSFAYACPATLIESAIWKRALTISEMRSLYANRMQLRYKPEVRVWDYEAAGGGGATTSHVFPRQRPRQRQNTLLRM